MLKIQLICRVRLSDMGKLAVWWEYFGYFVDHHRNIRRSKATHWVWTIRWAYSMLGIPWVSTLFDQPIGFWDREHLQNPPAGLQAAESHGNGALRTSRTSDAKCLNLCDLAGCRTVGDGSDPKRAGKPVGKLRNYRTIVYKRWPFH